MYRLVQRTIIALWVILILQSVSVAADVRQTADIKLPNPTGTHAVGTFSVLLVDESRDEPATAEADARKLAIQVWYPAKLNAGPTPERAPYFSNLEAYESTWGNQRVQLLQRIKTNSYLRVECADADHPFPVILFSHGWQSTRFLYSSMLEDLASHGFIVVGIDHPYMGSVLIGGKVTPSREDQFATPEQLLEHYAADVSFVIDELARFNTTHAQLAQRIDLERVGAMGHSNGFLPVMAAAQADNRIKAALVHDKFENELAFLFQSNIPLLLFKTESAETPSQSFFDQSTADLYFLELAAKHSSCSDPSILESNSDAAARKSLELIKRYTARYFTRYLGNAANDSIEIDEADRDRVRIKAAEN